MLFGKLLCLDYLKYGAVLTLFLGQGSFVFAERSASSKGELEKIPMPVIERFQGIPSAFIGLGNYHPTYAIVVEKDHHRLSIFRLLQNGHYEIVKTYAAVTGKMAGEKVHRGDNRTPVGIYFTVGETTGEVLRKKWGEEQAKKYGVHAFFLDYPNIYDKRSRKTGSGIWIHGVASDSRLLTPFDTEGCVALRNEDVLELKNYITAFHTPVVIVDKMETTTPENILQQRVRALDMINQWKDAWQRSDFQAYMAYYSQDFRSLGFNRKQWLNFKSHLSKVRDKKIEVLISEPKIVAFRNQLLVVFLQSYSANDKKDFGRKFLYLQQEDDSYRIIAEKWYPVAHSADLVATLLPNENPTESFTNKQPNARLIAQAAEESPKKMSDANPVHPVDNSYSSYKIIVPTEPEKPETVAPASESRAPVAVPKEAVAIAPAAEAEKALRVDMEEFASSEIVVTSDRVQAIPPVKFVGNVKFDDIALSPHAVGTKLTFNLRKLDSEDTKKLSGHICVVVKTEDKQSIFPVSARIRENENELNCVGEAVRFAWLRPTEILISEPAEKIKGLTFIFSSLSPKLAAESKAASELAIENKGTSELAAEVLAPAVKSKQEQSAPELAAESKESSPELAPEVLAPVTESKESAPELAPEVLAPVTESKESAPEAVAESKESAPELIADASVPAAKNKEQDIPVAESKRTPVLKFIGDVKFDNAVVSALEAGKTRITFDLRKQDENDHAKLAGYLCVVGKVGNKQVISPEGARVSMKSSLCRKGEYVRFAFRRPSEFILPKAYHELDEITVFFTPRQKR